MDICIVGGGASSFICAIILRKRGYNVTIVEKNNSVMKKLLLTGNGKCNYFNEDMTVKHYRSSNKELLNNIINEENSKKVLDFFESLGIVPRIKNGYYYPYSNSSTTIKNLLLVEAERLRINIKTNTKVLDIIKNDKFILKTTNGDITCDKVVIASGSSASIKNDDYNIYDILSNLGHTIIKVVPSLVMLVGNEKYFKEWAGIRSDVSVSLYENNKLIKCENGEVQLTDYGVSGICIMNLSGIVSRGLLNNKNEELRINFIPFVNNGKEYLENRSKLHKDLTIIELLESIINYKLLYVICKKNNIDTNKKYNELTNEEKNKFIEDLFNFRLNITGTKGIEYSQVVSGGVSLNEVNNHFESKIINGLYLIGEVLDVDGDCGGYNLGFAWISGLIVGEEI